MAVEEIKYKNGLRVCPNCGSIFVEYDIRSQSWRCKLIECSWVEEHSEDRASTKNVSEKIRRVLEEFSI